MKENIIVSRKEVSRLTILKDVENKKLRQIKAAELLNLSDRQVRNLLKVMRREGVEGRAIAR